VSQQAGSLLYGQATGEAAGASAGATGGPSDTAGAGGGAGAAGEDVVDAEIVDEDDKK
jgi:molecular chaperone DnaK